MKSRALVHATGCIIIDNLDEKLALLDEETISYFMQNDIEFFDVTKMKV